MDELSLLLAACQARKPLKTPSLVISRELMRQKVREFYAFAPQLKVFYSMKANPHPDVITSLEPLDIGFEVSSLQELQTLVTLGISPNRIISSNPVKTPSFVKNAFKLGINEFVIDSYVEAQKIASLAPGSGIIMRLAVDNSGSAWPLARKYGVETEDALDLFIQARRLGLKPLGVTFHVGSQCITLSSWDMALKKTAKLWCRAQAAGMELKVLNVGGGFPARHRLGLPSASEILESILQRTKELFPLGTKVVVEPGRALVADAGVLVSSVIGKAFRHNEQWIYLDVGVFNGMMEAVGGIDYAYTLLYRHRKNGSAPCTLAGPSCDSFDVIAKDVLLPELEVGDKILIFPGGAYTTAYASRFNGSVLPKTLVV